MALIDESRKADALLIGYLHCPRGVVNTSEAMCQVGPLPEPEDSCTTVRQRTDWVEKDPTSANLMYVSGASCE